MEQSRAKICYIEIDESIVFFDRFSLIVRVNVFKGAVNFALKEIIVLAKKSKKESCGSGKAQTTAKG